MATAETEWPDRMNPTDALFWQMDKIPELRSTIGALLLLERPPSRKRVRKEFERLSHALPRLRQQVVEVPWALAPPEWVADPQFDLNYHLRHVAVPAPGGVAELLDELSPLYATAFDRDRPLWEAYLAEGLADGRGAVFVKMHHCLTDGVGGTRLFAELLAAGAERAVGQAAPRLEVRDTTAAALLARAAWYNLEEGTKTGGAALRAAMAAVRDPGAMLDGIRAGVRAATGFSRELVLLRAESPLHQHRSLSRQLSTFEMALPDIETARQPLNATINDLVLTIVSGAMHRWHRSRGADVNELRAMVPVNLRGAEDVKAGNRLALLAVRLPVGEPDPLRRLALIRERIGHVKTDRRATMYPLMARVMLALPLAVADQLAHQQTRRTNFLCTNVPGPAHTCYLAGEAIERIYPYAPLVGDHPVAIALYSYRDVLCVGLDVDPLAMHDLGRFRDALQEAYQEVLRIGGAAGRAGNRRSSARRTARQGPARARPPRAAHP